MSGSPQTSIAFQRGQTATSSLWHLPAGSATRFTVPKNYQWELQMELIPWPKYSLCLPDHSFWNNKSQHGGTQTHWAAVCLFSLLKCVTITLPSAWSLSLLNILFYTIFCSRKGEKAEETRQCSHDAFLYHICCQVNFFNTKEIEIPWENGHGHLRGRQTPLCKQEMALASLSLGSSPGTCNNCETTLAIFLEALI